MQACVENVDISICVCKKKLHFDQRPKVSHYQVQRADVFVDNPSVHTEVLTEVVWRDQKRSRAAHYCTHTSLLLLPRLALLVALLSMSVSSLPYSHTHQHSWHRGT